MLALGFALPGPAGSWGGCEALGVETRAAGGQGLPLASPVLREGRAWGQPVWKTETREKL